MKKDITQSRKGAKDYKRLEGCEWSGNDAPSSASLRFCMILFTIAVLCTSCVSQYKVTVNFSPELKEYFTEFPTIEVDIAAITDSEANELKQAGVENYFAPGSGLRERFQSRTAFFYQEEQGGFVLASRDPVWQSWLLKEPTSILVIASLPPGPSTSPEADPRYMVVKMAKSYILARNLKILVEPERIVKLN